MLDFSDAPYQFFPPRPSRPFMALCRCVNRAYSLRSRNHRVLDVEVHGDTGALEAVRRSGDRVLFVANHSTHSDPQVLTEVQRRAGFRSAYMAAYDVFLRSRFAAWVMQRNGAFSIDRDGADRKAMGTAAGLLCAGELSLTIFPEGNVFFTNDRTDGFLPGAAFIAQKAQKSLGANGRVVVVPVSLKFTYLDDVRPAVLGCLGSIAGEIGTGIDPGASPVAELQRVGLLLLARNLKQRGHWPGANDSGGDITASTDGQNVFDTLKASAERITSGLEQKMELPSKPDAPLAPRLAKIRTTVHQILTDPDRKIDHRAAAAWGDEAILAIRIIGYGTPYVADNPSLDRFAETVEKLHEDLYHRPSRPFGTRLALAWIGQPIDLTTWPGNTPTDGQSPKKKPGAAELTREFESRIQSGIDKLNSLNTAEGSKPMSSC